MMNDEERLLEQFGRKRPFTVPEGYFDQFQKSIIENLTAQKPLTVHASLWTRVRKPLAAVAGVCALVGVGLGLLTGGSENSNPSTSVPSSDRQNIAAATHVKHLDVAPSVEMAATLPNPFKTAEQQTETEAPPTNRAPQAVGQKSQTTAARPQATVATTEEASKEETLDALDIAADLMMADADDLYAMLSEE